MRHSSAHYKHLTNSQRSVKLHPHLSDYKKIRVHIFLQDPFSEIIIFFNSLTAFRGISTQNFHLEKRIDEAQN